MTPEQIELLYELQTAAQDYTWNTEHSRKRAATDPTGDHLEDASRAERHASLYRRAAEALVALTTPGTTAHARLVTLVTAWQAAARVVSVRADATQWQQHGLAHDALLAWAEHETAGIASVSDSHGNTWVMLVDGATTTGTCGTCAHYEQLGPSSRGLCRNSQSIAVDSHVTPDDGCIKGYTPKATP